MDDSKQQPSVRPGSISKMWRNKSPIGLIRAAVSEFFDDDAMTLAAALAFYAALSLAPMVLLLIWAGELLGPDTQGKLLRQLESYAGPQASQSIQTVVENASSTPELGTIAGIASIVATLVAASGVFAQLQRAMNRIWDVPRRSAGAKGWLRKRAISLLMILIAGGMLVGSLVLSAILSALKEAQALPGDQYVWRAVDLAVSVVVFALLFAAVFKILPDTHIGWRSTWFGALTTAVLFLIGKWLVGLYLAHSAVASPYGAAGSLLVLLVWVYYCAIIFFFGAELTQVWARLHGRELPDDHRRGRMLTS
jgi:membrane protein